MKVYASILTFPAKKARSILCIFPTKPHAPQLKVCPYPIFEPHAFDGFFKFPGNTHLINLFTEGAFFVDGPPEILALVKFDGGFGCA
ncbi:MAG: hypothetical protein LJE96_08460 [Deltaproteobacteria bacterium]|nr:hypothetical protein [Deltaproteobacteria bacterium]